VVSHSTSRLGTDDRDCGHLNLLIGYGARSGPAGAKLLLILPILIAVAFMLIADIDAPRHGLIRVVPQNLISFADSLRGS
jgi:hypothetical protein